MEVVDWRKQGKTLVARIQGLDDRESACKFPGAVIAVGQEQLPRLEDGAFYWHQLVGMKVVTDFGEGLTGLGRVTDLIETGSNDVLVVRSAGKEYLIPWILEDYVFDVDLSANRMKVHWDPGF